MVLPAASDYAEYALHQTLKTIRVSLHGVLITSALAWRFKTKSLIIKALFFPKVKPQLEQLLECYCLLCGPTGVWELTVGAVEKGANENPRKGHVSIEEGRWNVKSLSVLHLPSPHFGHAVWLSFSFLNTSIGVEEKHISYEPEYWEFLDLNSRPHRVPSFCLEL